MSQPIEITYYVRNSESFEHTPFGYTKGGVPQWMKIELKRYGEVKATRLLTTEEQDAVANDPDWELVMQKYWNGEDDLLMSQHSNFQFSIRDIYPVAQYLFPAEFPSPREQC